MTRLTTNTETFSYMPTRRKVLENAKTRQEVIRDSMTTGLAARVEQAMRRSHQLERQREAALILLQRYAAGADRSAMGSQRSTRR